MSACRTFGHVGVLTSSRRGSAAFRSAPLLLHKGENRPQRRCYTGQDQPSTGRHILANYTRIPLEIRFWKYVTAGEPDECWEWQGASDHHGYGRIQRGGRNGGVLKAHRASYELHHGAFDADLDVCHRCDNPRCVNPAHLFLGTARDNSRDMINKGRGNGAWGQRPSPQLHLTNDDVRAIRERFANGDRASVLAMAFGIRTQYVYELAYGNRRAEAPGPLTRRSAA